MTTFTVSKRKTVIEKRQIVVETIRFISPATGPLNDLPCSGCLQKVGEKRPIAIAFGEGRGWRLCYECSKHLQITGEKEPR